MVSNTKSKFAVGHGYGEIMRYLNRRYRIVRVAVCKCGALTFELDRGIGYSVSRENAPKFLPELPSAFWRWAELFADRYTHCNHCVNHWGLDLCACGSGQSPETCDRGCPVCGKPSEQLKERVA